MQQPDTSVEVSLGAFTIEDKNLHTKASWSPFAGMSVGAQVSKVTLRGEVVFENGEVVAKPGSGRLLP